MLMKKMDSITKKDSTILYKGTFFICTLCGAKKRSFYHLWLCKERHKRDKQEAVLVGVLKE